MSLQFCCSSKVFAFVCTLNTPWTVVIIFICGTCKNTKTIGGTTKSKTFAFDPQSPCVRVNSLSYWKYKLLISSHLIHFFTILFSSKYSVLCNKLIFQQKQKLVSTILFANSNVSIVQTNLEPSREKVPSLQELFGNLIQFTIQF